MKTLPDYGIPLPQLSDEAAVEILDYLEAMFQIFEISYAKQIARYYEANSRFKQHPSIDRHEPF